jgi:ubiquinone/menaquinone biosynthesis C-methylase UbiE
MEPVWEHPDWYDLHDTAWGGGSEREPEHYRELVLALPPLDRESHVIDVGAGTGKLAALIAGAYRELGAVTLVEPNPRKLQRARERLTGILPHLRLQALAVALGEGRPLPQGQADFVTVGSVFMPGLELRGGSLADGLAWLRRALGEIRTMLRPGGWLYVLETLAAPWAGGGAGDPVRRLTMAELTAEVGGTGFERVECVYRFRDRVTLRARRPER